MKKKMFFALIIFKLLVLSLFAADAKSNAPAKILFGSPSSLTGMYAAFGEGQAFGMKAAVDDINKSGGIYIKEYGKKLPVKLTIVNSESDPQKAGALAEQMVLKEKVNFLVTGGEPPVMGPGVSIIADRYKIPFVTAAGPLEPWLAMRQEVEGHWEYTWAAGFAICTPALAGPTWNEPGYMVLETWKIMLNKFGNKTNKKVALFAAADSDGVAWYELFSMELKKMGYDVIGIDKKLGLVPMETTDFSSMINAWKNSDCQILWGNAPSVFVGPLLKQCSGLGFKPKMASIGRAAMFYEDIQAWGGDLPLGICCEIQGDPSLQMSKGIGGTTLKSLAERWTRETGKQLNRCIGSGYRSIQILADAIERAGTLDKEKVNLALAETDFMSIEYRVKFDKTHCTQEPLAFGQWHKVNKPWVWECPVIFSSHKYIKTTADPIFPIPYK